MKTPGRIFVSLALALFVCILAGCVGLKTSKSSTSQLMARVSTSFDKDWRFLKDDATGAEMPDFDDSVWRKLDVPHDWSIAGPFDENNPTRGSGGFLPAGVGWYRKHFSLPADDESRRVFVQFDGVMANSDVWINGQHLGKRPYGYASFSYELTSYLNFGEKSNVLAVRADNSGQPASRWYAGAGIYRHVRLVVTDPVHIEQWGVFVTTPEATPEKATVQVQTAITNQSAAARQITVQTTLVAPDGGSVAMIQSEETLQPGSNVVCRQTLSFNRPQLWDLIQPQLYSAVSRIYDGKKLLDDTATPFGIRHFEFRPDTGFWLNGRNFKLYGVCLHHDGSAFGAAVPLGAWERRLAALKELGVNAIRTAHNPPAPEFLDLCDRMGFLVMDEFFDCWTVGKNRYDYHLYFNEWSKTDARDTILRDRNHPSIVLYSVGNEIRDTPKEELAKGILKGLVEVCHEADPTRPVTQALFRPNVSHDYDNGLAAMLDVVGTNYRDNEMLAAQRNHPDWKIVGTEQRHDRQTWLWLRDNPSHSGQFLWSGIDYLGESRRWPIVAAGSGLLDRTGTPKPMAYERQSWWLNKPMVFIARRAARQQRAGADPGFTPLDRRQVLFGDWTPPNSETHNENVEVYSNCEEVELFLNGKSLGSKPINSDASPRNWDVAYEPGTLKAVGRDGGKDVATFELHTAGKPAKIVLTPDAKKLSSSWDDVCFVEATVVDENGVLVPDANELITFNVTGPGVVTAVDSGDNASHEPFQASERRAYQGQCFAILRATSTSGRITLTASAPGLESGSTTIRASR